MASPDQDGTLEKGRAVTFGSWTSVADGSGGYINHLVDHQLEKSNSSWQQLPNNSAALAAAVQNPPEDSQEEEIFDLINRHWADPDVPLASYD